MSRRSRRDVSVYSAAAEWALLAVIGFAPLALGSAAPWALPPIVALSFLALALSVVGAARQRQRLDVSPVAAVLAVCCALIAIQLVPLPTSVLSVLSPNNAELREFALVPLGLDGARPITMDAPSTWRELAKHLAYAAVALAAYQLARSRRSARRLLAGVALTSVLVTLIGLVHLMIQAEALFGFYAFEGVTPLLTTFGNPNHLAGYLTVGATAGMALALTADDRSRMALWGGAFVTVGIGALLTLSRGGIVFFFAAPVLLVALLVIKRWSPRGARDSEGLPTTGRSRWVQVGGVVFAATVGVGVLGAYLAYDQITAELSSADSIEKLRHSKLEIWPSIFNAAREFTLGGMGRGAFEPAFTRFQDLHPTVTFTHPENLVLQLLSEFGFVAGGLVLVLGAWALWRLGRATASGPLELAVLAGVCAVLLHDQVDFALEFPATALAAVVLLSVASRTSEDRILSVPVPAAVGSSVAFGAAAVAGLVLAHPDLHRSERLLAAKTDAGLELAKLREAALAAIDRHPAHYALYGLVGRAYADPKRGDPREALAFANRSLFLRPVDVDAHWIAARSLLKLGKRSQAFLEYRLAYEAGMASARVLDDALRFARGPDELRRCVPAEPSSLTYLVERLRAKGRIEEANGVLAAALDELRDHPRVAELWAQHAAYKLQARDPAAALVAIEEAERRSPDDRRIAIGKANVLGAMGRGDDAIDLLRQLSIRFPDDVSVAFALADHYIAARRYREAREVLDRVTPFVGLSHQRVHLLSVQARTFEAEGRTSRALQAWESASHLVPDDAGVRMNIARLEESLGRYEDAARSVRAAMSASGDSTGALKEWLARLDAKVTARRQERERQLLETPPERIGME